LSQDSGKTWAEIEFGNVSLGDARLVKRLVSIAQKLGEQPTASIPQACGTWDHIKGTYRFFDNHRVEEGKILAAHHQASQDRAREHPVVLAVQDTTQLDFTHHPATSELGHLHDQEHQGLFYHPTLLLSPEKVPLGLAHHQVWTRPQEEFGKKYIRKKRPIQEKESHKWLRSLEATARLQAALPDVCFVNIADREADIYDFFRLARQLGVHLLVRAAWNRRVAQPEKYLWHHLTAQPVAGYHTVEVPRRPANKGRQASLTIRFTPVTIQPPKHRYPDKDLEPVAVWAVYALEEEPPPGLAPISWMLLTTIPVTSLEESIEKIQYYTCRWAIELLFKILKSGCRIEELQLETGARLRRCLAVYSVVAWRVLFLTMQCRQQPDISCEAILEPKEWQALYCFSHETSQVPSIPLTLSEATRLIAQLGGFIGRRRDGHPGPITIWRGLQRLKDITFAWRLGRSP
jgi:hypothetical protein